MLRQVISLGDYVREHPEMRCLVHLPEGGSFNVDGTSALDDDLKTYKVRDILAVGNTRSLIYLSNVKTFKTIEGVQTALF